MCIFEDENNVCAIGACMYSSNNERQYVATNLKYFMNVKNQTKIARNESHILMRYVKQKKVYVKIFVAVFILDIILLKLLFFQ